MHADFGIARERHNKLYYKQYQNDKGAFHFHSQIELYFIDEGEMEVVVGRQRRILKGGEMSVSLSYDSHAYKTPEASRSSVLIIPPYICEEFISAIRHKRVTNPFITDKDTVAKIKVYYNKILNEGLNEIEQLGYIYVILGIVMDSIGFEETDSAVEPELSSQLLFYLNDNFKNDISLESLSHTFGYSQSHLSRYFKSCFGIGINQYLTVIRLKNVIQLMHEKKHSITYCALESGFNSMRTFYRAFENEFNCSPKHYLEQI
ncbi:MAG: helix-turn-helix transcriptional regulator [Oscillospiraceae bacterium]|nr:helix-turn-helix transcriptional regulator [Oscillospiraceae bacterium]